MLPSAFPPGYDRKIRAPALGPSSGSAPTATFRERYRGARPGKLAGAVPSRSMWDRLEYVSDPPPAGGEPKAAVLAPLFEDAQGRVRLLLTKRPMTMPTHAGHLAFPGGRPAPGDDGPVETALRETHEEVGILPQDVEILGFLPPVDTVSFSLMVVPVVGRLQPEPLIRPDPWEVDRIFTPLVSDLLDPRGWRHEIWQGRTVWFFEIEGDVLWGATAWMTRRLLGLEDG